MLRLPVKHLQKSQFLNILNVTIVRGIQSGSSENVGDNSKHSDIIVAGGGLVGTTLACSLGKNKVLSDKRILLLEGGPKFKGFDGGEYRNRVSALNVSTVDLFKTVGAWDTIASMRYKPVKQMHVSDASSHALITFNKDNFEGDVAYIIENDLVLHAVYEQLDKLNNVEVQFGSRIEDVTLPGSSSNKSEVVLKSGGKVTCDLLVGADGMNSLVRKRMNVEPFTMDYNQMGLVATLELCENGDNAVAWQRFLPNGVVAMLPLTETLSSMVWSTSPSRAKELQSMPAQEFVDAVNEAFYKEYPKDTLTNNILSTIDTICPFTTKAVRQYPPAVTGVKDNSRACFPLGFGHTPSYCAQGVALVGDAAHRIHPLAGQGVNLGYGDVKCLTQVLSDAVYTGYKLGDKHALLKYERERLMKNVPVMLGVHGIQKMYSTTFSPIVMMRSVGLHITQNVPPLKKIFMQQAMG